MTKPERAGPLNSILKNTLEKHFEYSYNDVNTNLSNESFDVKWIEISKYIDLQNLQGQTNEGVALYHAVDDINNPSYFTFIISKAKRIYDPVNAKYEIQPLVVDPANKLCILKKVSTGYDFDTINPSERISYQDKYDNIVSVREWGGSGVLDLVNLPSNPRVCFFRGKDFFSFITQNISDLTSNTFSLVISNGCLLHPSISNFELHSPILTVSDQNGPRLGDSIDIAFPFSHQALDVGRLCPPDC